MVLHLSFDFDYTLADSSDGTVVCANYAMAALKMQQCSPSLIKRSVGLSLEKTFEFLSGFVSSSPAAAEFKRHFLDRAEQVMLQHIHFYSGTRTALDALKREGHYISIVSTKFKQRIEEALERDGLDPFIDDIVGGDCVQKNKPDPEGLLLAMQSSGIPADRTIYVGDSVSDGECAQRAGVTFIAILSGTTSASQLTEWNPSRVLDSVEQLATMEITQR
jgi:phosphoglycolate phosphatase|tara:strand:+ start:238 stop:894 length:657 start_codon:yes stop_codon:yes gene_type:complete